MTDSYDAGTTATLLVAWETGPGGSPADVSAQTITIKTAAGATVVAATSTGIVHISTGVYSYPWVISASQAPGSYVVTWNATSAASAAVVAVEVVAVESAVSTLGDPYITAAQLKSRLGIADTVDDTAAGEAVLAASRALEKYCNRAFGRVETATARLYPVPPVSQVIRVDDFWTTTDLAIAIDSAGDGTYATSWLSSTYQLEPLNGVCDGESGWPYSLIRPTNWYSLAAYLGRPRAAVQVTAKWGWADVPAGVLSAAYLLAMDYLALKDARFGLAGGGGDFGPWRVRENARAEAMLSPYARNPILVGG